MDKVCIITICCIGVYIKAQHIVISRRLILANDDLNQSIFATSSTKRDALNCKFFAKIKVINIASQNKNTKKAKCSERNLCFFIRTKINQISG